MEPKMVQKPTLAQLGSPGGPRGSPGVDFEQIFDHFRTYFGMIFWRFLEVHQCMDPFARILHPRFTPFWGYMLVPQKDPVFLFFFLCLRLFWLHVFLFLFTGCLGSRMLRPRLMTLHLAITPSAADICLISTAANVNDLCLELRCYGRSRISPPSRKTLQAKMWTHIAVSKPALRVPY